MKVSELLKVNGPHHGRPNVYYVDGPVSRAGWSLWYRAAWCRNVNGVWGWDIENHQERPIKVDGKLGKQIVAAVERYRKDHT